VLMYPHAGRGPVLKRLAECAQPAAVIEDVER
jgi:hypothetical protein